MYRFLPILIFAFGFSLSNEYDDLIQSAIDFRVNDINGDINNILDTDRMFVKVSYQVIDTNLIDFNVDYSIEGLNKLESIIVDLQGKESTGYIAEPINNSPIILVLKYQFNIYFDTMLKNDGELNNYKNMMTNFVGAHPWCRNCQDEISFSFIDIDSSKKNISKSINLNKNKIYDESWAVIIGIDKYQNHSILEYAVEDAEAVKEMLLSKFNYSEENVKLLLNEDANKTNIEKVVSNISLNAGRNDRILIFFAGHGVTMSLPDGGEMGYLLPIDGNQENLFASAIPMDDLKRLSNISKAKHMLFLVDACYGGLAAVGSRGLEPTKTLNYLEKISRMKSRQIITAGGKNEEVFEKSEWGHSAYTKNLLSALEDGLADSNNDGYITADELGDYLSEKVSIDSESLQTPQSHRLTSHEGEFIFFSDATIPSFNTDEDEIIYGCMDENANNYNPDATQPDRSCQYGQLVSFLAFGQFDEVDNIVPIIMNNNEPISQFEFSVMGVKVLNVFGGITEEKGMQVINNFDWSGDGTLNPEGRVLGISNNKEMDISSGGNQILCYLQIEIFKDLSLKNMCMSNIRLTNSEGKDLKNIYNASLTCYGD